MTDPTFGSAAPIDVAIIGGGPSGLSAAIELKRLGISRVIVLERENEAGGIPRHCGHPPFGMREFKRILTGSTYAKKLVTTAIAAGVEIHVLTTVVEARPNGELLVLTAKGIKSIMPRRVIYSTGVRERPRSARLISGDRVAGVLNTGALQSMIYLNGCKPFNRPVIIGTELVSFSAIMTCRHAGIKPVAMIEEREQPTARFPSSLYPRIIGIPFLLDTKLLSIRGTKQVEAVEVETKGQRHRIECDGVILSGNFTPEASLARCGHLIVDPATGGPMVDQQGRCSDPAYFSTGNLLRPVETAGWCWNEGRLTGRLVAEDLADKLPGFNQKMHISVAGSHFKYVMPQTIRLPLSIGMKTLQLRFSKNAKGVLVATNGGKTVYRRTMTTHPERRVLVPLDELADNCGDGELQLTFEEKS